MVLKFKLFVHNIAIVLDKYVEFNAVYIIAQYFEHLKRNTISMKIVEWVMFTFTHLLSPLIFAY